MIRNIVFDMGNVLVDYDGDLVCRALIPDEEMRKRIYTTVFVSPEWVKLDMGIISEEQGLTYVHPFNDPTLATGQGTISYEIFQDLPDVDVILVPIGGGGLAAS